MAALTFTKSNSVYVATATVTGDFNVHVETTEAGKISLMASTTQAGKKVTVYNDSIQSVFDHDFDAKVYPKYLKVISTAPVSSATITTA